MTDYRTRFARLRSDTAASRWTAATRFRAPHKPLLLLAVMDLIASGHIATNLVTLDAALSERFTAYWRIVMPDARRCNPVMPFFHLAREARPFWHLQARAPDEALDMAERIKSGTRLNALVSGATLDDDLWIALHDADERAALRRVLIERAVEETLRDAVAAMGI